MYGHNIAFAIEQSPTNQEDKRWADELKSTKINSRKTSASEIILNPKRSLLDTISFVVIF